MIALGKVQTPTKSRERVQHLLLAEKGRTSRSFDPWQSEWSNRKEAEMLFTG